MADKTTVKFGIVVLILGVLLFWFGLYSYRKERQKILDSRSNQQQQELDSSREEQKDLDSFYKAGKEELVFSYDSDDKDDSSGGKQAGSEPLLVFHAWRDIEDDFVEARAYFLESTGILDLKLEVEMYSERTKVKDVILAGLKRGRLTEKENIDSRYRINLPKIEGLTQFAERVKVTRPRGVLTKELLIFRVPREDIFPDMHYELWVDIGRVDDDSKPVRFRFDWENLPDFSLMPADKIGVK